MANALEIEQLFHQGGVVRHGIDDLHAGVPQRQVTDGIEVDVFSVECPVFADLPSAREDGLGDTLRGRAAIGRVELDAEVRVRAARIVAGGENDAAVGPVLADDAGGGRRGEQAALAHNDPGHTIGRRHAENDLDRLPVVITAITAQHECAALEVRLGVEDRLDKVFQVVGRLELPDFFAQTGGAGALVGEGLGGDG